MDRQAHFAAILARAQARQGLSVYDTEAPLNADGTVVRDSYVVLHDLGSDEIGDDRFSAPVLATSARVMRIVGRCVGEDAAAVRRITTALIGQMAGWAPTVSGRSCWPLKLAGESEIHEDKAVKPPLPFADVDFTYRTEPV